MDVVMPQMGESIAQGTITKWLKGPGDTVEKDETLFEIATDKVDAEIPSPAAGTLGQILIEEGATVDVGTIVAKLDTGDGDAGSAAPAPGGGAGRGASAGCHGKRRRGSGGDLACAGRAGRRRRPVPGLGQGDRLQGRPATPALDPGGA